MWEMTRSHVVLPHVSSSRLFPDIRATHMCAVTRNDSFICEVMDESYVKWLVPGHIYVKWMIVPIRWMSHMWHDSYHVWSDGWAMWMSQFTYVVIDETLSRVGLPYEWVWVNSHMALSQFTYGSDIWKWWMRESHMEVIESHMEVMWVTYGSNVSHIWK